jgi:transposase
MDSSQRLASRKKYSQPFLDKIKAWLLGQQDQHVPGTPMAKAIVYASINGTNYICLLKMGK